MAQWINVLRNNSYVNSTRLPLLCGKTRYGTRSYGRLARAVGSNFKPVQPRDMVSECSHKLNVRVSCYSESQRQVWSRDHAILIQNLGSLRACPQLKLACFEKSKKQCQCILLSITVHTYIQQITNTGCVRISGLQTGLFIITC